MRDPGPDDPSAEEALRAVFVNGAAPSTGPIVLADYDPAWPERFRREEARIRGALGPSALLVEHVGSTSVPGLHHADAKTAVIEAILAAADADA